MSCNSRKLFLFSSGFGGGGGIEGEKGTVGSPAVKLTAGCHGAPERISWTCCELDILFLS